MTLSVKEIENAQPKSTPWKLHDERGLYLQIAPNCSKRWHHRYSFQGQKKKISYGGFPDVSLKSARTKRDNSRALVAEGIDPLKKRSAQKVEAKIASENNFGAIAREFIAMRANDGDKAISPTTLKKTEWLLTLLEPKLGRVPVREITPPRLLKRCKKFKIRGGERQHEDAGL